MDQKDYERLQQLEKFVAHVASALETQRQLQKDPDKDSLAYTSTMRAVCLLSIKRELKKVIK